MTRGADSAVVPLSRSDLDAVEVLRAENNGTLGFLPMGVMAEYLVQGGGFGVRGANGLAAYCLFSLQRRHIRVIHLCVAAPARGAGHARRLVDAVVDVAKNQRVGAIKLNCRRDYPANAVWPELGFVALDEKEAKTRGESLVTWCRDVPGAAQEDIFAAVASDDRVDAVIDAQLVFQLGGSNEDTAKGLQADYLADLLVLYVTAETFVEIDRGKSAEQRRRSRNLAQAFPRVQYDVDRMAAVEQDLRQTLPFSTASQRSDIRQIAMTATSNVNIFLTRDERLLAKATEIKQITSVDILRPYQLIVRLDEFTDSESYKSTPVSGIGLAWRKLAAAEATALPVGELLGLHERKAGLKGRLDTVLANPRTWRTEALWLEDTLVALRSVRYDRRRDRLVVGLCRAARGAAGRSFTEYAIASAAGEAVEEGFSAIELVDDSITPEAVEAALRLDFVATDVGFVRYCPAKIMSIATLRAMSHPRTYGASATDLERACSPVALKDGDVPCIMVPIKPGYARSLFDTNLAADDLFGAERSVLLGLENVYFRRSSHHHMMQAPARILWYVSGGMGVVAISHLDDVQIGYPKDMFRDHRRLGTLRWADIWEMCRGEKLQTIMVLKFSHTFLFRSPVDYGSLKQLFGKHSRSLVVQSPSRVSKDLFLQIYELGFGSASKP